MVFNATFNNISVILWHLVLLVEATGVLGENHWQILSHIMLYLEHLAMSGIGTHNFVLLREILNTLSHYTNSIIKYRCFNHLHCFIFCLICYRSLDLPKEAIDLAGKRQFELKGSCFTAEKENLRQANNKLSFQNIICKIHWLDLPVAYLLVLDS
jgi:hypothetical protein